MATRYTVRLVGIHSWGPSAHSGWGVLEHGGWDEAAGGWAGGNGEHAQAGGNGRAFLLGGLGAYVTGWVVAQHV